LKFVSYVNFAPTDKHQVCTNVTAENMLKIEDWKYFHSFCLAVATKTLNKLLKEL